MDFVQPTGRAFSTAALEDGGFMLNWVQSGEIIPDNPFKHGNHTFLPCIFISSANWLLMLMTITTIILIPSFKVISHFFPPSPKSSRHSQLALLYSLHKQSGAQRGLGGFSEDSQWSGPILGAPVHISLLPGSHLHPLDDC